jgi:large subunit ribosomal protein L24
MKIKKGDSVVIISGKDRTKTGKVIRVFPDAQKVFVDGITRKKHKRSRTQEKHGEIIHVPFPVAVSSVKLVCPKCGKAARIGYDVSGDKKARMCKKCGKNID